MSEKPLDMNPPSSFYVEKTAIFNKLPFAYSGAKGPGSWGKLNANFTKCGTSDRQSPIDLPDPVSDEASSAAYSALPAAHLKYIEMAYRSVEVVSFYEGAQLGFSLLGDPGELVLNDEHFVAKQALFHTPSVHTIGGLPVEMEMQIRHKSKRTNRTAIVSVLFKRGRNNTVIDPVFQHMIKNFAVYNTPLNNTALGKFDLLDVIPFDPGFVVYNGSLTVPPCTDDVLWLVVDKPITASVEQIATIKNITGDNARPEQQRNGRTVKRIGMSSTSLMLSMLQRMTSAL